MPSVRTIVILILIVLGIALFAFIAFFVSSHRNASQQHTQFGTFPIAKTIANQLAPQPTAKPARDIQTVWFVDYSGDRIVGVNRTTGKIIWEQTFSFPSVEGSGEASNVEFMTIAGNGNIMISTSNGMLVQEIDRISRKVVWQYGVLNEQYCNKCLHQPKKAYLINNGTEVLVTDANNRRVVIINKNTKKIVWEYGHKNVIKDAVGYLKGNRFAMPMDDLASNILISDTLTSKIMIVDRATKQITWEHKQPNSKWLQNVFPTSGGTFVAEDHLKHEVFEVNKDGQVLWTLHTLADGSTLNYPTDAIKIENGNVLISEGGKRRIIEVNPTTKEIVWKFAGAGLPTAIAVEY